MKLMGTGSAIWNQTGQKQNSDIAPWEKVNIDLSAYKTNKIRFKGVTGKTYTSDIALDNITITTISNDNPLPVPLTELNRLKGYVATQDIYLNNYKISNEPDSASLAITNETIEVMGSVSISKAMRLKPMDNPPANPLMGDIYVNISNALCIYMDGKWNKVTGTGTCERDLTAPALLIIEVSPDGKDVVLTYDEDIDDSVLPSDSDFLISSSSNVPINVTDIDVDGPTVTLTLDRIIEGDETLALNYAAGAAPIQDSAGNDAALIDETQSVTNNSQYIIGFKIGAITPTSVQENTVYTSNAPSVTGETPIGNLTYTISPDTAPFSVNSSTGIITMFPIDYEAGTTTYTVILTATDEASPANVIDKTLTITITNLIDETPALTAPVAAFTVAEDAAVGYVLGSLTISANDSDASNTAITLSETGNENFEVVNDSGTWNLKVKSGSSLDYETTQTYNLKAQVSNGSVTGNQVDMVINVTNVVDITPVLTAPGTNFSVAEDAAVGYVLGSLTISANDSNTSSTAITLTGTGNEIFEVTNDSGTWNLKVKDRTNLDFETTTSYSLTATATNDAGSGTPVAVTINVTNVVDITPVLTAPGTNFSVAEDAAVGYVLGSLTISANDSSDSGTAITLSETGNENFEVTKNGTTWELKVKAGATLDYETTISYNLKAEVSNGSLTGNKVNVVINVTNAAEITGITLDTPANLTYFPGASIQFIVSYDKDVTVNDAGGKPAINLHIGSDNLGFIDTGKAEYNSALTTAHNVSTDIVFEYIVGSADDHTDIDGIEITDLSIKLNSGTIEDASNNDASLDFTNITIPVLTKVLVDAKMWNIMTGAGFIYIPTWDVNSDGTKEPGFWIAKYEAKDAGSSITIPSKTLRGYMSETFNVYNPATKDFDQKLCSDGTTGTHSGTTPAIGTGIGTGDGRQSAFSVANLDTFNFSLNTVNFVKDNAPLADINAVEAALILEDSQITDGEEIKLPTSMQWEQVVGLIINNKANWSHAGTILNGEDPTSVHEDMTSLTLDKIFNGHSLTDGPAVSADIDINGYTGLPAFNKYYRRTLVVANDISVRDYKNTPIVDSDDVSVKVNDPAVASNYAAVIWDFSGNVSEWTRELVAANAETGQGGSVGGDRFIDGEAEWNEFNNTIQTEAKPSYFMPTWFEPRLSSNIRTNDSKGFGRYNDGDSNTGTPCSYEYGSTTPIDFGYGTNNDNTSTTRDGGFAALYRGGSYDNNRYDYSGLNLLSAGVSPAYRAPFIGFRAASSTQKGTKGIESEK